MFLAQTQLNSFSTPYFLARTLRYNNGNINSKEEHPPTTNKRNGLAHSWLGNEVEVPRRRTGANWIWPVRLSFARVGMAFHRSGNDNDANSSPEKANNQRMPLGYTTAQKNDQKPRGDEWQQPSFGGKFNSRMASHGTTIVAAWLGYSALSFECAIA